MLTFKMVDGKVTEVIPPSDASARWTKPEPGATYVDRNDWDDFEDAAAVAFQATVATGEQYVPTDGGRGLWPRYDVVRVPKVGEPVSYAFNGDYYPDGYVASVSTSSRVIRTTTGHTYYRRLQTGTWLRTGGTWALVRGHVSERNPSF